MGTMERQGKWAIADRAKRIAVKLPKGPLTRSREPEQTLKQKTGDPTPIKPVVVN